MPDNKQWLPLIVWKSEISYCLGRGLKTYKVSSIVLYCSKAS